MGLIISKAPLNKLSASLITFLTPHETVCALFQLLIQLRVNARHILVGEKLVYDLPPNNQHFVYQK